MIKKGNKIISIILMSLLMTLFSLQSNYVSAATTIKEVPSLTSSTLKAATKTYDKTATNGDFGSFKYRDKTETKGLIEIDPTWVSKNIVAMELPKNLQGLEAFQKVKSLRVNKAVLENWKSVFKILSKDADLLKLVTSLDPGTFWARHIRNDFSKGISNHSWGTAIDINASTHDCKIDPKKTPKDPNYLLWKKVFEPSGFSWGNDYSDSMHYEILKVK